jgi:hypothetical protein
MWTARTALALAVLACSSNQAIHEERSFVDAEGRACTARVEKSSSGALVLAEQVTCDAEAKACSGEASGCFQLSADANTAVLRNCPACCLGRSSSFLGADCSALVCETSADCVYKRASCMEGSCVCANGECDD